MKRAFLSVKINGILYTLDKFKKSYGRSTLKADWLQATSKQHQQHMLLHMSLHMDYITLINTFA